MTAQHRWSAALELSRAGLNYFPYSDDLECVFREAWSHAGDEAFKDALAHSKPDGKVDGYAEIIDLHLRFDDLDRAREIATQLTERHENNKASWVCYGNVALATFRRDHRAHDGRTALNSFRQATELDPRDARATMGLAYTYAEIGATRQAAFHALLAIELDPQMEEARTLYDRVRALPVQRGRENDLLWETEFRDQACAMDHAQPKDEGFVQRVEDGLQRLSRTEGVHTVAIKHRGLKLLAERGHSHPLESRWESAFVELAGVLRQEGSKVTKRLGLGRFLEADLRTDEGRVLAVAAGPSVMMLTVDEDAAASDLADMARDQLDEHTASWNEELEWVRPKMAMS